LYLCIIFLKAVVLTLKKEKSMRNLDKRVGNTYYTPNSGSVNYTKSLSSYLTDISKYKILSNVETKKLIQKARKDDEKAISELVNCNQRFVFSLSKRFSDGNNDLLSDLINEANIGLMTSIKRFNPKKDNTFLTYSVYWMQRQIFSYLAFVNPMVKISNKSKTTRVPEIKNRFMILNGRKPTSEEILDELQNSYGIDILNETDIYQFSTTSIDSDTITENYDDFSSFFTANQVGNHDGASVVSHNEYDDNVEDNYTKILISNSIGVLTKKEKKVIELLYGFGDYREYKIQEVAEKLGMSKEGVRLINKRAIEKLKEEIIIKQEVI
jgi:RNA polymerase sigma factor (sigma-70 family)